MTAEEKLNMVKVILKVPSGDSSEDERISTYLDVASREIISWRYSYGAQEEAVTQVPEEYEMTQIYAVVAGYSQMGAENETYHHENGINRQFRFSDMIDYIRHNVIPLAKVVVME